MKHIKLFFQVVLGLAVLIAVMGVVYAFFSFIVFGSIAVLIIAALLGTADEIWKDIKRKRVK